MAGLKAAVERRSDEAIIEQVVAADWNQQLARIRCRVLQRRYPNASVIWAASDPMAIGAIEAIRDSGLTPGDDLIVGGVDATLEAMDLIEEGTMFASVGGHVMDGGWAMVLLHDFFHGVDLKRIPKHIKSPMRLVTRENVDAYRILFDRSTWKQADFRQFSLLHQSDAKAYHFDMRKLLPKLDRELFGNDEQDLDEHLDTEKPDTEQSESVGPNPEAPKSVEPNAAEPDLNAAEPSFRSFRSFRRVGQGATATQTHHWKPNLRSAIWWVLTADAV